MKNPFPISNKPGTKNILILFTLILLVTILLISGVSTSPSDTKYDIARDAVIEANTVQDEAQEQIRNAVNLVYSHPDSARVLLGNKLKTLEEFASPTIELSIYNAIGASYFYQANFNQALKYFYKILELSFAENQPRFKATAYLNIGLVNINARQYKDAIGFLMKATEIFETLNDTINKSNTITNLGSIYLNLNDLEKAKKYFDEANKGFMSMNNHIGGAAIANYYAQYYIKKNEPDSAMAYFEKGINLCREVHHNYGLYSIYLEKGDFFRNSGEYSKAIKNYYTSDSLSMILKSKQQGCYAKLGLAQTYLQMGNTYNALHLVNRVAEINRELKNEELDYKINEVFSIIYDAKGDIKKSFNHYKLANEQKASLFDQTEVYQVYNIEIEGLSNKMRLQEVEVEKQSLQLARRKNSIYLILVFSISLLVIVSLLYLFYINKVKLSQKDKLHQNFIRHSLEKKRGAMEAEIQERKRLGMELHDGVGPLISVAKLYVTNVLEDNTLSPERKTDLLNKTAINLDEILREMKNISYNLAPLVLIEKGFEYAVRALVAKVKNLNIHTVNININGLGEMEISYEHAFYRTIQEIINNIIFHANAKEINIEILQNENDITIMIEDDGDGFENNDNILGLGLKSAASRIEDIGGTFFIDSKLGRGTIITIISPVNQLVNAQA